MPSFSHTSTADLPSPPAADNKAGGGTKADAGIDDDLAARFEALKRG